MTHLRALFGALAALLSLAGAAPALAGDGSGLTRVDLRPGWRMADGSHMAALHIVLEPGWKTYWRAPGDVGIPPQFDWTGSRNVASVNPSWPTPDVFFEQGMRSVGYMSEVVIPLHLTAVTPDAALEVAGQMQIGICKDICIPATLAFDATLTDAVRTPDPVIAAALTDRPYSASEAGVRGVTCRFAAAEDGGVVLHSSIDMPSIGGTEHVVVETGNPHVWVAEPDSQRTGSTLETATRMVHVDGRSFVLDRSALRFTVIGNARAVDIKGCTP